MLFFIFFLFLLIVGYMRRRYYGSGLGLFGYFSIFVTYALCDIAIEKSHGLIVPDTHIIFFDVLFVLTIALVFRYIFVLYKKNVNKQNKTNDDIKKRQKLLRFMSYMMAFSVTSLPFILSSWGLPFLSNPISLGDFDYGVRLSLFITIIVFFIDNIINRFSSEIYIYDDVADIKKFCLYLRSFGLDKNKEEKIICGMTNNLYPVYAIGDPNKMLQPNGAERIFLTDDVWQNVVKDMSARGKLILLRVGQTEGTLWELTNIVESGLTMKTIFITYSQADYNCFSKKIAKYYNIEMPDVDFSDGKPNAFFIVDKEGLMTVVQYRITRAKDVKKMLNQYLDFSPKLAEEYAKDLELSKHRLRYLFDKNVIPESIRKSLNWGIISILVNTRRWPISLAGILIIIFLLSIYVTKNTILIYIFCFIFFLLGNRVDWLSCSWSCASHFLRHQRREARLIWFSLVHGILFTGIYLVLHSATPLKNAVPVVMICAIPSAIMWMIIWRKER